MNEEDEAEYIWAQRRQQYEHRNDNKCSDRLEWTKCTIADQEVISSEDCNVCTHPTRSQYEQCYDDQTAETGMNWKTCTKQYDYDETSSDINDYTEYNICAQTRFQNEQSVDDHRHTETRLKWKDCTGADICEKTSLNSKNTIEYDLFTYSNTNLYQNNVDICSETRNKLEQCKEPDICTETRLKCVQCMKKQPDVCAETRLKSEKNKEDICTKTRLKQKVTDICKRTRLKHEKADRVKKNIKAKLKDAEICTDQINRKDADVCTDNKLKNNICEAESQDTSIDDTCPRKRVADLLTEKIIKSADELCQGPDVKIKTEIRRKDKDKLEVLLEPEPAPVEFDNTKPKVDVCGDTRKIREKVVREEFFQCWKAVVVIFGVFCVIGVAAAGFAMIYSNAPPVSTPNAYAALDVPHF